MKIKILIYITCIFILIGAGLSVYFYYLGSPSTKNLRIESFNINDLPENEKPYNDKEPIDPDNIDLKTDINNNNGYSYIYKDNGANYNPVTASRMILELIDSYKKTQNKFYLEKAELYTVEFLKSTTHYRGAMFFTYKFDYTIIDTAHTLKNPWYSGMAQGRALSVFSRLYKITGKKEYKTSAQETFRALKLTRQNNSKIWVSMVKDGGYFWIEEYTFDKPEYVLNGFLYSTFGLYDYYLMEQTPESKKYLDAALTTAKYEIPKYRRPGKVSKYGLKRGSYNPTYHKTVTKQMRYLFAFTQDEFFKKMADTFEQDYK